MTLTLKDFYTQGLELARRDMESRLADELQTSIQGRMNLVRQRFGNSRRDFKEYGAELGRLCNYELFLLTLEGRLLPGFSWDDAATLYVELLEHHEKAERLWAGIAADAGSERAYYFKMITDLYFKRAKDYWRRYTKLALDYANLEHESQRILEAATSGYPAAVAWADARFAEVCESMHTLHLPS